MSWGTIETLSYWETGLKKQIIRDGWSISFWFRALYHGGAGRGVLQEAWVLGLLCWCISVWCRTSCLASLGPSGLTHTMKEPEKVTPPQFFLTNSMRVLWGSSAAAEFVLLLPPEASWNRNKESLACMWEWGRIYGRPVHGKPESYPWFLFCVVVIVRRELY